MAAHKFDEQLREKLSQREIAPSKGAWQKLSAQLDESDGKKGGFYHWKYIVAACMIGLLITFIWFNENNSSEITDPSIVNTEIREGETKEIAPDKTNEVNVDIPENTEAVIPLKKSTVKENRNNVALVPAEKKPKDPAVTDKDPVNFMDAKVAEVVAQVQALKEQKDSVTDAEVEALLLSAEKEIRFQKIINQETGTVNAEALLQEVETELERSFRDRVFDALSKGFKKTKTAVANRNN